MRVILSGGGSGQDSKEMDELFAGMLDKNKPLLYVPIALHGKKNYNECLSWLQSTFKPLGITRYEMAAEDTIEAYSEPNNYAGIYIGGGNTFYLLSILKESSFWDFLQKALQTNTPIFGGSAGAMIFAPSIIPASNYDESAGYWDTKGFGLTEPYWLTCHYMLQERETIQKMMKVHTVNKLIALPESTGILISEKGLMVVGKEPAHLFKSGCESLIPVGERL